jgi:uncharacterized membrane protein YdjX (TVP38/TMEM64 family)
MTKNWILHGLFWGFFMFLMMAIAIPFAEDQPLTLKSLSLKFVFWMIGGLVYGFIMQKIEAKGKNKLTRPN